MLLNPFRSFLNHLNHSRGRRYAVKRGGRRIGRIGNARVRRNESPNTTEVLEDRLLLAATPLATADFVVQGGQVGAPASPSQAKPATSPGPTSPALTTTPLTPAQMQAAYGVNLISFGSVQGTGAGQTIAIVDPYNDANIIPDTNAFSSQFKLPTFNGTGGPTLQVLNQLGSTNLSGIPNPTPGTWDLLESEDVQWAHAIAPQANIVLYEANSSSESDLLTAEQTAANNPAVSVVEITWGFAESSTETANDSDFLTPNGHQGITFLASAGDSGAPAQYPAFSPNVVSVGGTTLLTNSAGAYLGESAWSGSGGGVSLYESQPSYQTGKVNNTSSTNRTAPDVALDADPNVGVYVLDSLAGGYKPMGGTALATSMMAGLVAIADQGRVVNDLGTLYGSSQTLPLLYNLSSANFHDITTGNNGFAAGPGYDLATGLGAPAGNDLVMNLAGSQSSPPPTVTAPLTATLNQGGSYTFNGTISVSDPAATATSETLTLTAIDGTVDLQTTTGLTFVSGANNSSSLTVTGTLANLNAALATLLYAPNSGYSGSDYLQVSVKDANDSETGWSSVNINVNPLQPPAITAPPSATDLVNHVYVFSGGTISVTDPAAFGASDSVTLWSYYGGITLSSLTNLTFQNGTINGSSSMTFSGTIGAINAALNGLVYTPQQGYLGPDTLSITVKDTGDNLSSSTDVAISVVNVTPPVVTAPANGTVLEDGSLTFPAAAISISDIAATGQSDFLSLSVSNGSLTFGTTTGLSFVGSTNGTSSLTVNGTLASLNAALGNLTYAPNANYSGGDALQISVTDAADDLTGTASVALTVSPSGFPVITAPQQQVLNSGVAAVFSTANGNLISFTDTLASGASDSLTLTAADGTLALSTTNGLNIVSGSNDSSSMTVNGTVAGLNAALSGLTYTPNAGYAGSDSLQITVNDASSGRSGSATVALMIAGWTNLTNPVANNDVDGGVNLTLLLPNGDLLAHGAGDGGYSANWYKLTPDSQGNYTDGTWTQVASMNVGRLYFGSVVLPNGNVFVVGGEYSSDGGFSRTAETYNPTTNVWTLDTPDPQDAVGDEEAELLPNGNILVGNVENNGTEIYNPTTNTWSAGGNKIYTDDVSDEEGWTKLPNGDILTYDIFASIDANKFLAEIYNPTTNTWSDASNSANGKSLPLFSTPETGYESGLLATLPDGRALLVGTNGNTAFYNYHTNSWTLGPNLPEVVIDGVETQMTIGDGSGAVLPNGNVLMSVSPAVNVDPVTGEEDFPPPQFIYEFNPVTGVFTDVTPTSSSYFIFNYDSFIDDMLVLPTGQIFMTQFDTDPLVLTPGGAAQPSWMPTITSLVNNGNGNYTLTGTQLNGLDEGGYYGDDNQMATNYPIVQVRDDLTGDVYYATTSNWSSNWVATGSTPETVNVAFPSQIGSDPYSLVVIANGISSIPYYSNGGPPGTIAPASITVTENSSFTFPTNAFAFTDVAAVGSSDSVTLTVSNGTLELGSTLGLTFSGGGTGTSSMTVSGTMPALNAAIANLVYVPDADYQGPDSLQITLHDSTDNLSASTKVNIAVVALPSPGLLAPPSVAVNENTEYFFSGTPISVNDPVAAGPVTVSLSVNNGQLFLGTTGGLTFISSQEGDASITVSGTLANLNTDLGSLAYLPNVGFFGPDALQVLLTDPGDRLTAFVTVPIAVSGPPAISAPAVVGLIENGSFTFNGTVSLFDGAVGPADTLTLTVSDGTLALGSTTGLNFGTTSNNSSSITISGSLLSLNEALDGLTYTAATGFVGTDLLRMSVTDATDSLSASAGVELTVSASVPPAISAPPSAIATENKSYTFPNNAFNIIDATASGTSDTLTLGVIGGGAYVTLGSTTGLTFDGGTSNSSSLIIVSGTLANLVGSLNGLVYVSGYDFAGTDTLELSVSDDIDNLTGASSVLITVNPTGPVVVVQPGLSFTQNRYASRGPSTSIAEDANGNLWFTEYGAIGERTAGGVTLTYLTTSYPALTNPEQIILGPGGNMYFTSTGNGQSAIGEINTSTFQISAFPLQDGQNGQPVNGFSGTGDGIAMAPGGADIWFVESADDRIGEMSASGINITQIPVSGVTTSLTGAIAFGSNDDLYLAFQERNEVVIYTQQGATVNTVPMPANVDIQNGNTAIISDPNGDFWITGTSYVIQLTPAGAPNSATPFTYTTYPAFQNPIGGPSGGLPDALVLNPADGSVWFADYAGGIGHILTNGDVVEYSFDNSLGIALDQAGTPWVSQGPGVSFNGISQLEIPTAGATFTENQTTTFVGNQAVGLIDPAGAAANESMYLDVQNGKLQVTATTGLTITSSQSGNYLELQGSLAAIQTALATLAYTPNPGYLGPDLLSSYAHDTSTQMTSGFANMVITVVQSSPAITVPPSVTVGPNTPYTFSNSAIKITDASASATSDTLTLSVAHGTLSLGSTAGLSFGSTTNNSSSITVSGTLSNLIAALSGLVYTPNANSTSSDTLSLSLKDAADGLAGSASVTLAPPSGHTTYVLLSKASPDVTSDQLVPNYESPVTPAEMEAAYGLTSLNLGALSNLGSGQTIALIDAYNDPDIVSDANTFSAAYGLPGFNGPGQPTLEVLNQTGGTTVSNIENAADFGWDVEESLDVEWAHSMAPGANIILFEANTNNFSDLLTAEVTAANTPGVSAVSNSWGGSEFQGEQQLDSDFVHAGVTFMASTGDGGPPTGYPAMSPDVVAVGGTSLYVNSKGAYLGESVWGNEAGDGAGSGGVSQFEAQPSYQTGKVNSTSSEFRTTPDVSLDADPITGVLVYDSDSVDWYQVGGTSLASPLFSGIIAIANQVRASNKLQPLNSTSPTQTLSMLYSVPAGSYFHDISTGISNYVDDFGDNFENGFPASYGYDIASGLGSPIGNNLITFLGGNNTSPPTVNAPINATSYTNNTAGNGVEWINLFSVYDPLASPTSDTLTLTADDGTIELGSDSGLTLLSGANGTSSMSFRGTIANLDAALANLTYVPKTTNYVGADYIQVSLYDPNNGLTGWATTNITDELVSAPTIQGPLLGKIMIENQPETDGEFLLSDQEATATSDSVTLTVDNGTIGLQTTQGIQFSSGSNNSSSMTITGPLVSLNQAIATVNYTPIANYLGFDWIQATVLDSGDGLSESVAGVLDVTTTGGPNIVATKSVAEVAENTPYTFAANAIILSDAAALGYSDTVSLDVSHGTLNLATTNGVAIVSGANGSSSMTVSGTLASLQAAITGLMYTPAANFESGDGLGIVLTNTTYQAPVAIANILIDVNAKPTWTAPASISVTENGSYTFTGGALSITDPGAATTQSLSLSVGHGTLDLLSTSGLQITLGANNSSTMTVSGSLTNLNAALSDLKYSPKSSYTGQDSLVLNYTDEDDTLTASDTVSITVSPSTAPLIQAPSSVNGIINTNFPFSATNNAVISVSDSLGNSTPEQMTLTVEFGTLNLNTTTGLLVTGAGTSSMMLSGMLSSLNADLPSLVYTPAPNFVNAVDQLNLSVQDTDNGLTGTSSTAIHYYNWAPTANPIPSSGQAGVSLLLSNGDILVKGGGDTDTGTWYLLTPSSSNGVAGGYVDGTWSQAGSMNVGRLYFGSAVLPDGDVFVVGGESTTGQNEGNSAEIYDPNTNSWKQVASAPQAFVGNVPVEVLPDGTVMVPIPNQDITESYNPATNTWTQNSTPIFGNIGPWAKLPGGGILSYNNSLNEFPNQGTAEVFNTSAARDVFWFWQNASFGNLPLLTSSSQDSEMGPELLLPNGQVFVGGGNGQTAYYNSANGQWTAGPMMPSVMINGVSTQLAMANSPGAVLPDGDLLLALSPEVNGSNAPGPTFLYDFSPSTNTFVDVTPPPSAGFDLSQNGAVDSMLVLPSGQVLLTNFEGQPFIYTPSAGAQTAWQPTITSFTNNGNGSDTLTGTQLNGLDEGASGGVNNQMAENYPIVQITDTATGKIYYATTSNWSSVNVATGSALESVNVVLPAALNGDPFTLVVIANGIASNSFSGMSITAPASVNVTTNASVTFPSATASAIALSDPAASGTSDSLTLTVSHGSLNLPTTTGLTFLNSTSNNSSSISVSGTLANLNSALDGLSYTPASGFGSTDSLGISFSDSGDSLTLTGSVTLLVGTAPVVSAPPTLTAPFGDGGVVLSGANAISVTDSQGTSEQMTLTTVQGTLDLDDTAGLTTVTGENSSSLVLTGTLSTLNSDLPSLIYYPPRTAYSGPDTITVSDTDTTDNQTGSAVINVNVTPAAPGVSVPDIVYVSAPGTLAFTGPDAITVTDAFGTAEQFEIAAYRGTFSLGTTTGLTVSGNGTSFLSATGSLASLTSDLASLTYTAGADFGIDDQVAVYDTDTADGLTQHASLTIFKTKPSVTAPLSESVNENSSLTFPTGQIILNDGWATTTSDTLSLSDSNGTLNLFTLAGLTLINGTTNDSSLINVTGPLASMQAALDGLVYTPTHGTSGTDSIVVSLFNSSDVETGSATIGITINAIPTSPVVAAPASVNVTENSNPGFTFSGDSTISITDALASGSSDTVSLSVSNGTIGLSTTSGLIFTAGASGDSSMTFSGPLADLNMALSGLTYTPTHGTFGNDALVISVADSNDSLSGGSVVLINVQPLAPPAINVPGSFSLLENGAIHYDVVISDPDPAASTETLTFSASHGTLNLQSTTGLNFVGGTSNDSSSITVTGALSTLNSDLSEGLFFYAPNPGYYGPDTIVYSAFDPDDNRTGTATTAVSVTGPPQITAPPTAAVNENGSNLFFGPINLTDTSSVNPMQSLTLTVSHGTLTLGSTAGLNFGSTSNNSSSITVTGSLTSVNAALAGLSYTPTQRWVGGDTLQISATDTGDSLSSSTSVPITINPLPTPAVNAPPTASVTENASLTFPRGAISVGDLVATGNDTLTLKVGHGTITLASTTGLNFGTTSNGSSSITVTGTFANLNADLNGLVYTPTSLYHGGDTLSLSLNDAADNETGSANVLITVIALTPPRVFAPANETISQNNLLTFPNGTLLVTDPSASGSSDTMTLSVGQGTLYLGSTAGLTFNSGSSGSASMIVTGSLANLNSALSGLEYLSGSTFSGVDTFSISVKDSLDGLSGNTSVAIAVEGPPAVTAPQNVSVTENGSYVFPGGAVTLTDSSATPTSDSLTLVVKQGTLQLGSTNQLTLVSGAYGSSSITVTGSLTNLNAAVDGLIYTPNLAYYGADALQLTLNDSANLLAGSAIVNLTVNPLAPPTISAPSQVAMVRNTPYTFAGGAINLIDATASGNSETLTLSVADGTLALGGTTTGLSITGNSSSMTVTGSLAGLTAALNGLVYTPNSGFTGNDTLKLALADSIDKQQGSAAVTLDVVTLANPTVAGPSTVSLAENATYTFAAGAITVTDIDAIGSTTDSVTLTVADGKLSLGSTAGITVGPGANNSSLMTITGSLASVNAALSGLVYTPTATFSGHDTLSISVTDNGDNLTGSTSVAIGVTPAITAPASGTVNENATLTFSTTGSNAITLIDGAAGSSDSLTLSSTNGTLTLATTTGLTLTGTNGSSSMTIKGTLASLNAALNGLKYSPTTGYSGSAALSLSLTDPGDSLSTSTSVAITVNPLPAVSAPASETDLENASLPFSVSGKDAITLTDPIASGTSDSITLKVSHGTLTLASTAGVTILSGTNGSSSLTIQATLTNLNSALNGLTYTPTTGYIGSDTLSISVTDSNDNATGSASVAITVASRSIKGATAGVATTSTPPTTQAAAPADSMTTSSSTPTQEETDQWAGVTAAVNAM